MSSGWVVATIRKAICVPLVCSKAASLSSSPLSWIASSVPVWSMTCADSGGTGSRFCANAQTANNASRKANRRFMRYSATAGRFVGGSFLAEVHLRRGGNLGFVLHGEVRLGLVMERHRRQVGREAARQDVVLLHRLDVAVARHGDAVFRALELHAQLAETLVGFQIGIAFAHGQQPAQCAGQFSLRLLEFLERFRVV